MTDRTITPHPKPGKRKREWIKVYPDGREVLNLDTKRGLEEYRNRRLEMARRQNWSCCLIPFGCGCHPRSLNTQTITFEHENGRGAGKRDDRIEKNGRWLNGASNFDCNGWKGSIFIDFNGNAKHP